MKRKFIVVTEDIGKEIEEIRSMMTPVVGRNKVTIGEAISRIVFFYKENIKNGE